MNLLNLVLGWEVGIESGNRWYERFKLRRCELREYPLISGRGAVGVGEVIDDNLIDSDSSTFELPFVRKRLYCCFEYVKLSLPAVFYSQIPVFSIWLDPLFFESLFIIHSFECWFHFKFE